MPAQAKAREKSRSPVATARARPEVAATVGLPAAQRRRVEDVVVDQGRHVDELDRDRGADRRGRAASAPAQSRTSSGRRRLPPAWQRRRRVLAEHRAVAAGEIAQPRLDVAHPRRQPGAGRVDDRGDRWRDG